MKEDIMATCRRMGSILAHRVFIPFFDLAFRLDSHNIERWRQRNALAETGLFVEQHMSSVPAFTDSLDVLRYAIEHVDTTRKGLICEFGVATGRTINHIADQLPSAIIHGFDSFEGLPENWRDGYLKRAFKVKELPQVRPNVKLHQGWFEDTLPPFLEQHSDTVLFLHIDCDLYSSTKAVFNAFRERIKLGTIILFDEFFNYPGWKEGECKAFMEFIDEMNYSFEYLTYCKTAHQVAVKINTGSLVRGT